MSSPVTDPTEVRLRALVLEIQHAAAGRYGHSSDRHRRAGMHEAALMLRGALDEMYGRPRDRKVAEAA
jgi:hypothetical protein